MAVFYGCASTSVERRYQDNKTHARLSPHARTRLRDKDVDDTACLIANSTRKRIIGITTVARDQHPNAFLVTIGIPWREEPYSYGFYKVVRDGAESGALSSGMRFSVPALRGGSLQRTQSMNRSNPAMQRTRLQAGRCEVRI
jgi:hypothetical protein